MFPFIFPQFKILVWVHSTSKTWFETIFVWTVEGAWKGKNLWTDDDGQASCLLKNFEGDKEDSRKAWD